MNTYHTSDYISETHILLSLYALGGLNETYILLLLCVLIYFKCELETTNLVHHHHCIKQHAHYNIQTISDDDDEEDSGDDNDDDLLSLPHQVQ